MISEKLQKLLAELDGTESLVAPFVLDEPFVFDGNMPFDAPVRWACSFAMERRDYPP